ncbi:MAG: glycosyltransferase family 4 protein [Aquabacterium sp.]
MKPLRILWAMPYLPWPITSGGKARQFHLIQEMAGRGHAITLLVQSKTPLDEATRCALSPFVKELIVLPRRALKHPRTLWHAAMSPLPLLTSINGHAPALAARFAELLRAHTWDVVQIEHSYGMQPFEAELRKAGRRFALTEHNVESALGAATYGKWPRLLRGLVGYDQYRARRWERHILKQASVLIAVTDADAASMKGFTGREAAVVANGVDTRAFASVEPAFDAGVALFVGNYEYAPNVDAVEWALTEIWPRVWRVAPQLRFCVCGHGLPASWPQRFSDPRIEWRGYVPDLRDVQSRCAVFLSPLRAGGGSKLKVLEAMAAGLPLVCTSESLSGLGAADGVHALVRDDAEALAAALVTLMGEPSLARQMGQAARGLVSERFDWRRSADQLEAAHAQLLTLEQRAP